MQRGSRIAAIALLLAACGGSDGGDLRFAAFHPGKPPAELERGAVLYASYCASCHGVHAKGQGLGPPLLDTLFLPARVSDSAMVLAILAGAPQQSWNFGAMPPVSRVDTVEVPAVVAYVRWLQGEYHATATGGNSGTP